MQVYIAKGEYRRLKKEKERKKKIHESRKVKKKGIKPRSASHHTKCFIGLLLANPIIHFHYL